MASAEEMFSLTPPAPFPSKKYLFIIIHCCNHHVKSITKNDYPVTGVSSLSLEAYFTAFDIYVYAGGWETGGKVVQFPFKQFTHYLVLAQN